MKNYTVPVRCYYDFKPSNNQKSHENGSFNLFARYVTVIENNTCLKSLKISKKILPMTPRTAKAISFY